MRKYWTTILAGGDGTRLRAITRQLSGDNRPKQFCRLMGTETLFDATRARVALLAPPSRTLFVLTEKHRRYYRDAIAGVPRSLCIEQPTNRGTAVAIAFAVARLLRHDPDGIVGFFPSDHYYCNPRNLRDALTIAYAAADTHPGWLFLIGAEADRAETEYGWIEPGGAFEGDHRVHRVTRFWEKPPLPVAEVLCDRGCLWNTFITVGSALTFASLISAACPALWTAAMDVVSAPTAKLEAERARQLYRRVAPVDFSKDVLSASTSRMAVVRMLGAGWVDLGHPDRLAYVAGLAVPPAFVSDTHEPAVAAHPATRPIATTDAHAVIG